MPNILSLYTAVAIAKGCNRIGAVLSEKQSFSHFLDSCSNDRSTENEVEQGNLILALQHYIKQLSLYTAVAIAKCCTRIGAVLSEKQLISHFLDNSTENEVEREELNTGPTNLYKTFVVRKQSFD